WGANRGVPGRGAAPPDLRAAAPARRLAVALRRDPFERPIAPDACRHERRAPEVALVEELHPPRPEPVVAIRVDVSVGGIGESPHVEAPRRVRRAADELPRRAEHLDAAVG